MKTTHQLNRYDWGEMVWFINDELAPSPGISLARMVVHANCLSDLHMHPDCTETIHVLSGVINQRRGDDWVEVRSGETTYIPEGMSHQTQALGGEPAVLLIAYSSGARTYQSTS